MEYLPNEDEQRQQMTLEEEEQYKKEYEEWLDKFEKEKKDEPKR
jgi:hypothetical protein